MPRNFQFKSYPCDEHGADLGREIIEYLDFEETVQAKAHAGRLAKQSRGPVDVAFNSGLEWDARYITTAMPSEHHAKGYRLERLDG